MTGARGSGRRARGTPGADAPAGALDAAVRYLAHRPRTVAEVRRHLRGKGCGSAATGAAIRRLVDLGYLDDRAYAERYVTAAGAGRPRGRPRIRQELVGRGVEPAVVDAVLAERFGPAEESAALDEALAKARRGSTERLDAAGRRRIAARLMRRGFAPGQVMRALAIGGGGGDPVEDDERRREPPVEEGEI